jgi:hypothetical protein
VADDQLAATLEQVEQARPPGRTLEDVVLVDLDHRQHAALGVERVAPAGQLLLLDEQRPAGGQPFLA